MSRLIKRFKAVGLMTSSSLSQSAASQQNSEGDYGLGWIINENGRYRYIILGVHSSIEVIVLLISFEAAHI